MRVDGVTGDRTQSVREKLADRLVLRLLDHGVPVWLVVIMIVAALFVFYGSAAFVLGYAAHLGWDAAS